MGLADNIKKLRKKKGLTQADLAEKIGSHTSHINRIETGKYKPSLDVLMKIADVLEVSLDNLVKGIEDGFKEVKIEDKGLAQRVRLIDSLDSDDKKALIRVIDSMLTKQKILGLITDQQQIFEEVAK